MTALRQPLAGILIFAMILLTIGHGVTNLNSDISLLWAGGIAGWLAAMLLIPDTPLVLKVQVAVLILAGTTMIGYSAGQGDPVDFHRIVTSNTGLLTMIGAVGFLKLVALPGTIHDQPLPTGRKAFLQTLTGVSLFSSVINVSAPILICDRIHEERPLTRLTSMSISRVFCSVSSWSPFYGAMAVVLTYVPDARLSWLIVAGLPFSIFGLLLVYAASIRSRPQEVNDFIGYPMQPALLVIPVFLVLSVIGGFVLLEDAPALIIIALCGLLVTLIALFCRYGVKKAIRRFSSFITSGLPRIVNELVLFLSAGVLAVGIQSLIQGGLLDNPFMEFSAVSAAQLLAVMLALSCIGIHPVIQISSFSPLLLELDPNANLLAVTYLFAWHLGTCSSPLSGTNLMFQGRYGIPSWKGAVWNWPYSAAMLVIGICWLFSIALLLPGYQ